MVANLFQLVQESCQRSYRRSDSRYIRCFPHNRVHGSTVRLPHLTSGTRRALRRNTYPRVREVGIKEGVQAHQGHHDLEADSTLCFLGHLVFLLQVSEPMLE